MKRIISIFSIAFAVLLFSCNQATDAANSAGDAVKGAAGKVEKTINEHAGHDHSSHEHAEEGKDLKDHVCTAACKEAGKCVFACGEKGHVCTDACHAEAKTEHKCSDKCTKGTHKCGNHCGCGDSCACTAESSCSDQCKIKKG